MTQSFRIVTALVVAVSTVAAKPQSYFGNWGFFLRAAVAKDAYDEAIFVNTAGYFPTVSSWVQIGSLSFDNFDSRHVIPVMRDLTDQNIIPDPPIITTVFVTVPSIDHYNKTDLKLTVTKLHSFGLTTVVTLGVNPSIHRKNKYARAIKELKKEIRQFNSTIQFEGDSLTGGVLKQWESVLRDVDYLSVSLHPFLTLNEDSTPGEINYAISCDTKESKLNDMVNEVSKAMSEAKIRKPLVIGGSYWPSFAEEAKYRKFATKDNLVNYHENFAAYVNSSDTKARFGFSYELTDEAHGEGFHAHLGVLDQDGNPKF